MLNATGGWTAIDEELDPDSTNPVQNKTLYNLETYHTLKSYNAAGYMIDDITNVPVKTPIKLFFDKDLTADGINDNLFIFPKQNTHPRYICVSKEGIFAKNMTPGVNITERITSENVYLTAHYVLKGFIDAEPVYNRVFIVENTSFEMFLKNEDGVFVIVGDPVVGKYEYTYSFTAAPRWNTTAKAIVYASGLKVQWGNFTYHSASNDEYATQQSYFPVKFTETPSMSFSYSNTGDNVERNDIPYAIDNEKWHLNLGYEKNNGTWMAIGY